MSEFRVEKLNNEEPIIVVTIIGHLTVDMAKAIYAKIAEISATIEGPIYRITDVRQEQTSLLEIIGVIKEASKGTPGSTSDPRIKNVFLGNEKMARTARDVLAKTAGPMPMFPTMELVLEHIRTEIAQSTGA